MAFDSAWVASRGEAVPVKMFFTPAWPFLDIFLAVEYSG
jgi:hypothetical protein